MVSLEARALAAAKRLKTPSQEQLPKFSGIDENTSVSEASAHTNSLYGSDFFDETESKLGSVSTTARNGVLTDDIKAEIDIVPTSLERETSNKLREAVPLGTLRFDRQKLYGREEYIAKLNDALFQVNRHATVELILIAGPSGSGKTALATSIQGDVERSPRGVYLQGKFDLAVREQPYTAVATALQDLCCRAREILGQEGFEQFQEAIRKNLDSMENQLLHGIIPSMSHIAPLPETAATRTDFRASIKLDDQKNRLHYAFVKFIRVACAAFSPLVIFLDDLQWADISSLDLLKVIMLDQGSANLMVIGTYRSNEVSPDLSKTIQEFRTPDKEAPKRQLLLSGQESKRNLKVSTFSTQSSNRQLTLPSQEIIGSNSRLTELTLGNLTVRDVKHIIMSLLSLEEESIAKPLAEVLHRRTLGNPNFLKTLITVLYEDNLLSFNVGTMQWTWDLQEIEKSSFASDNVVDLTRKGIERNTSKEMHHLLLCVACLGNLCDMKYIRLVWKKSYVGNTSERLLQQLLSHAVKQMFLEQIGTSQFRYSHDAVKEAVISLIPVNEFEALLQQVGAILFKELREEELEAMLFLVADLLHNSDWPDDRLSQLLLRAAQKAKGVSAFSSASFYALHGIKRLPNLWLGDENENIQLALKLHTIAAEAERCLGNLPQAKLLCKTIISQSRFPIFDKMQAHKIMIGMLLHDEEDAEVSLKYSLDCLADTIGCHFPRNKAGQALGAVHAITQMKKEKSIPTDKEMNDLPMMTDPRRLFGMELMRGATFVAFLSGKPILMLMILNRRIQWSLTYGFHASVATAYATMASVFMHKLGDWERSRRMADVATLAVERAKALGVAGNLEQEVLYRLYFLVTPWLKPAQSLSNQVIDGYKTCMLQGDVESALSIISIYSYNCLLSGNELNNLEADVQCYQPQATALKYGILAVNFGLTRQAALNLMGKTENTTFVEGYEGSALEKVAGGRGWFLQVQVIKRFLCAHFGEYKTGALNAIQFGSEFFKSYPGVMFGYATFHEAICHYGEARNIARNHGKSCRLAFHSAPHKQGFLFKKHAYKSHSRIESWAKKGAPNHVHHLSILDAERAALLSCTENIDKRKVCKLYEEAIKDSVRGGFVNHAALTEERYSDYLLGVGEKAEGIYHLENSIQRFSDWGATGRVKQLRVKLGMLTQTSLVGPESVECHSPAQDN